MARLEDLPGFANRCVSDLLSHADQLNVRIAEYDPLIAKAAREVDVRNRLMHSFVRQHADHAQRTRDTAPIA